MHSHLFAISFMILMFLFSLSEMVGAVPLLVCISDKFLLKDVCNKSSSSDEMHHGVYRCFTFPGDIFFVCV